MTEASSGRPGPASAQVSPLSVDTKTPPSLVPAKRSVPFTAKDRTNMSVNPVLTDLQPAPLSADTETPAPQGPAKRFGPIIARHMTPSLLFVFKPDVTAFQLVPLSDDMHTPSSVPPKMSGPLTATEWMEFLALPVNPGLALGH